MICEQCKIDFSEKEIDESHDVPCYLFKGITRNQRKNQADKFGRHWLCKKCHEKYEDNLRLELIKIAQDFRDKYFGESNGRVQ